MPYSISTSEFSFIQFNETDQIESCEFPDAEMCLPAFDDDDAWFQFVLTGQTEEEADALCAGTEPVTVGIVENCDDGYLLQFIQKPVRYRISPTKVLYYWPHGLPNFRNVINVGECFHIKIAMAVINDQTFCSNCFQRISDDCHTTVLQYSNNENAFGFNYCASADVSQGAAECDPTIIEFTLQATMVIPWTAFLEAKYGTTPNVQVWVYDENNELVKIGMRVALDAYPPTEIRLDFGGVSSGIIKIM